MRNEIHYTRIKLRDEDKFTSFINKSNWWKFILVIGLLIIMGPFFPGRYVSSNNYPKTEEEYWQKVVPLSFVMAVVVLILTWTLLIKPYLNSKRGYNLRGQFDVTKKIDLFGQKRVRLTPGTNHYIKLDAQSFKFINVGDRVLVERRPLGDIIKVKKV